MRTYLPRPYDDNPPPTDPPKSDPPPSTKTYSEDELKAKIDEAIKANTEAYNTRIADLQASVQKGEYTAEQKKKIEKELSDLKKATLTKEQLLEEEKARITEELQTQLKESQEVASKWEGLHKKTTIEREILTACSQPDTEVFNPQHVLAMLAPLAKYADKDDGYSVNIDFPSKDKDGNTVMLALSPKEALSKMITMPEHKNLFKAKGVEGFGHTSSGSGSNMTVEEIKKLASENPKEFNRLMKEGKIKHG